MRILKEIRAVIDNYHVKSGIYHFYRGEYKPAIEYLTRAASGNEPLSRTDASMAHYYITQAHLCAAEAADDEGNLERAVEELQEAAAANLRYPDIQFRLACALERAGRLPEAVEKYRLACTINPQYVEARTALAFLLMAIGRSKEAADEFQEVFKQIVGAIEAPFREGLRHLSEQHIDLASMDFRSAFFAEPYRLTKLCKAAMAHLRNERWAEAVEALREAVSLNPSYADLHNYLGVALAESGDMPSAVESFRRSLQLNPRYSIARLNLAYALFSVDEIKEAEQILDTLVKEDPGNTPARVKLEEIHGSRVDPRKLEVRRSGRAQGRG